MIAKLRRRHRIIFPVLGVIIVIIAVLGLQEKPEVLNSDLPGYSSSVPLDLIRDNTYNDDWDDSKIGSILYFSETEKAYYLQFIDRNYSTGADLLLYLNESLSKEISDTSKLIGNFIDDNSIYYKLPFTTLEGTSIILYSLPKKKVLAVANISRVEDSK